MPTLSESLAALVRFRATFDDGAQIDEETGLTADHLTIVISTVEGLAVDAGSPDPD